MDLYNASLGNETDEPIELTLEQFEEAKAALSTDIERGQAAIRLTNNADFKSLFLEGYLEDEPKRIAELMASGRLNKSSMEGCSDELASIGRARNYFKNMVEKGNYAQEELEALQEARDEAILAEEAALAGE